MGESTGGVQSQAHPEPDVQAPSADWVEAQRRQALDIALRYLDRADRTTLEVQRHLEGKRVEPTVIGQVLGALAEDGLLDDARYAQRFAADMRELKQWGSERITRRLIASGIDRDVVDATLAGRDRDAELSAALYVLRRRFPTPLRDDRARGRALGVLLRRGYAEDIAYDAVRAHGS